MFCPQPSRNEKHNSVLLSSAKTPASAAAYICGHFYLMFLISDRTHLLEIIKYSIFQVNWLRLCDILWRGYIHTKIAAQIHYTNHTLTAPD